jgi:hypothetical protein
MELYHTYSIINYVGVINVTVCRLLVSNGQSSALSGSNKSCPDLFSKQEKLGPFALLNAYSPDNQKNYKNSTRINKMNFQINILISKEHDRLCCLVVRFSGYRSRGPGSIPCATRFSEK